MVDGVVEPPFPDALGVEQAPAPHPLLEPVLGFLGVWRGRGRGGYPTLDGDFAYAQEVRFSHDGRPFLRYEARAWLLDGDGAPLRPAARESGWWRVQPGGRVEALVTQPTGITEILVGQAGEGAVDLATHTVALTPTAKEVTATRRRYTLAPDGDSDTFTFVHELAAVGQPLQHHLSATLRRAAGQSTPPTSSWNSSVQ
ncbi:MULTISPECIES: FABP family protein [Streptomyces]|uniref:FABP family protein n=1 Tax=Streptomyces TaxID=1883 RepID=UPI0001852E51|nr:MULTISPECIES: FABP family protein [Streptomyces]MYT06171.1 FABP family protein [Streptomyces sp. SID5470]